MSKRLPPGNVQCRELGTILARSGPLGGPDMGMNPAKRATRETRLPSSILRSSRSVGRDLAQELVKRTDTLQFRDDKGSPPWDLHTGK